MENEKTTSHKIASEEKLDLKMLRDFIRNQGHHILKLEKRLARLEHKWMMKFAKS